MKDVEFSINPTMDLENGRRYHILVKLPISIGWIEGMNFVIEKGNETINYPIKHSKNENYYVYFEGDIDLETSRTRRELP